MCVGGGAFREAALICSYSLDTCCVCHYAGLRNQASFEIIK